MNKTTASNNVSEDQKQANYFEKWTWKETEEHKRQLGQLINVQTIELLNFCKKAAKRYNQTRNPAN